jgi:hemoglobin
MFKEVMMKVKKLISGTFLGAIALLAATAASAAGNAQAGSAKSMFCAGCHGVDGNVAYISARLAGQSTAQFHDSLMAFKAGKRFHPVMNILSLGLTEQDAQDMGMFYASQKPFDMKNASLYWRLGGPDAVNAAVEETIKLSRADPRLAGRLSGACATKLKEQLCAGTGGPCTYTGRDMKTAHTGMKITEAEFGAVGENLVKVLDAFKVPEKEKGELLGLIMPMKGQIVGR